MKTKEEKSKKMNNFWKNNWPQVVMLILAILVISSLISAVVSTYVNKKSIENDIIENEVSSSFFIDKIVCYSSAYGVNNNETQARWNVNLSQYTDIAIYLNVKEEVSKMYIDNISFSNNSGNLSLQYLPVDNFGKVLNYEEPKQTSRIDLSLSTPITLRYLNSNFKENCTISDTNTPLTFDGSLLKRGKVTLSSLKNTISFTIHIVNNKNEDYAYPVKLPITLENKEEGKSIYDGSYLEEFNLNNFRN